MCAVLLPTGVNPIAVKKKIYIYIYYINTNISGSPVNATFKCPSLEDETDGLFPAIHNPLPTYCVNIPEQ
jgi:hypothetical protein